MRTDYINQFQREYEGLGIGFSFDEMEKYARYLTQCEQAYKKRIEDLEEKLWDAKIMREACESALATANETIASLSSASLPSSNREEQWIDVREHIPKQEQWIWIIDMTMPRYMREVLCVWYEGCKTPFTHWMPQSEPSPPTETKA